jgi:hypothetical protein
MSIRKCGLHEVFRRIFFLIFLYFVGFEILTATVMKCSAFWILTLCSQLKFNRGSGKKLSSPSSGLKSKSFACCLFQAGISLGLLFNPEDGGDISTETSLAFNRLNDVISQKILEPSFSLVYDAISI